MSAEAWCAPPDDLSLAPGVVDVWRARTDTRAAARAVLRRLLGRYTGENPETLQFRTGPHGKPALTGAPADVRFNLSHTRGLALYAVAHGVEVGVDVERPREGIDPVRMVRRFIGEQAAERLERLAPEERPAAFLATWVRFEAAVKCSGSGIAAQRSPGDPGEPWIVELDPGGGFAAAVAVAARPAQLRRWDWDAASGRPAPEP